MHFVGVRRMWPLLLFSRSKARNGQVVGLVRTASFEPIASYIDFLPLLTCREKHPCQMNGLLGREFNANGLEF